VQLVEYRLRIVRLVLLQCVFLWFEPSLTKHEDVRSLLFFGNRSELVGTVGAGPRVHRVLGHFRSFR
jgi:hypothetical protein